MAESYHAVGGVKRLGVLIDIGAADGLMGVDALAQYIRGTGVKP